MYRSDGKSRRVGLILLVTGLVLLAISVVIVLDRSGQSPESAPLAVRESAPGIARASWLTQAVLLISLVFLIFVVGTFAMVRFSRRFRAALLGRRATPTPSEDVWQMHRLPENHEQQQSGRPQD